MSLKSQIQEGVKEAMKKQDEVARLVLRSLMSEIGKKEIELGKREEGLSDEEVEKVVLQELKKRKEAAEQYREGEREELAKNEEAEAVVLEQYAPEQMSEDEIKSAIDDIIKDVEPSGMQDMGAVMKAVMQKVGSSADGSKVNALVRQKLSEL
ncbi:MAG: GatB/YqeY domain-containing protein [Candidatus Spechtbacterales bacterium]|nr:GatB/YqeY domain-containing protein [Candidatus Spechtbacterales bacterium]